MRIKSHDPKWVSVPQAIAYDHENNLYIQFGYKKRQRIEKYNSKGEYIGGRNFKNLGHANGLAVKGNYLLSVRGKSRKIVEINKNTLEVVKVVKSPTKSVGAISYDDKFYFSCGGYIYSGNLKKAKKIIKKKKPYKYQQDICKYRNYLFSCISVKKKKNRIDVWRYKDGWHFYKTIKNIPGGYELEGCDVDKNGKLMVLLNKRHKRDDYIIQVDY